MRASEAEPPPGRRNQIVKERVRRPLLGFGPVTASTGRGPPPSGLPYEASCPACRRQESSLPGPRHSLLHRGTVWRPLLGFGPATASTGRGPPPSGRSYKRTRPLVPAGHPLRSDRLHRASSFLRSAWERTSSTLCVVWNGRGASEAAVPTQSVGTRIVGGVSTPRDPIVGGVSTPRDPIVGGVSTPRDPIVGGVSTPRDPIVGGVSTPRDPIVGGVSTPRDPIVGGVSTPRDLFRPCGVGVHAPLSFHAFLPHHEQFPATTTTHTRQRCAGGVRACVVER